MKGSVLSLRAEPLSAFEILGSALPSSYLGALSGNLFLHLLNQLRQFLLTLLLAVGIDIPGHTFPVDPG